MSPVKANVEGVFEMELNQVVAEFLTQAIDSGGWMALDRLYLKNRVYAILELAPDAAVELEVIEDDYLGALMAFQEQRHLRTDQLADLVTPPPSVVNALFAQRYEKDPYDATAYFYQLNQLNKRVSGVQASQELTSAYGKLIYYPLRQTPVEARNSYPTCDYCMENEGFEGNEGSPSQLTQRMIRMNLQGTTWNYHFNPTPFWSEDCVFTSEDHQADISLAEKIDHLDTLNNLFPHYVVASLGQFSNHPAYLGGEMTFPVSQAPSSNSREATLFKGVTISEVSWPVTTVRMNSQNPQALKGAVSFFLTSLAKSQVTEPILIFSDRDHTKQVDIIFVETLTTPALALGVLCDQDQVSDFEQLTAFDAVKSQTINIQQPLQEL